MGDIIIIIIIIIFLLSPVTHLLSQLPLLSNQQLSPPFLLQVSVCSIMCDAPSTAIYCTESIKCFRVLCLCFGRFLLFFSLAQQLLFQHVNLNELNWSWIILINLLTKFSKSLYSCIIYPPVYSQLSFPSTNSTEQNCTLYALRKTIVSQISLSQL